MSTITERIDATTFIPPEYRGEIIPCPPSLKIEITSICNLRCAYCAHQLAMRPNALMDRALFSRIIREFREAGGKELGLFYIGESFLCGWLEEAIAEGKSLGFYVFLTTNGTQAVPDRVEGCMRAGLDSLKFSMNYADEQQFKEIAQVSPRFFERALQNLADARRIRDDGGYACRLYASSIKLTGEQMVKMDALLNERVRPFVDEHYFLPLYQFGGDATAAEIAKGLKPIAGNPGREGCMREPVPCWAVLKEAHCTVDGLLSACCFGHADRWTMGDLKTQSFMEAWNSKPFQELRRAHLAKDVRGTACEQCAKWI